MKRKTLLRTSFACAFAGVVMPATAAVAAPLRQSTGEEYAGLNNAYTQTVGYSTPLSLVSADSATHAPKQVPAKWSHFVHGTPYYKYDSTWGLNHAAKRKGNAKAIDLDWRVTKDGVIVNVHWDQPLKSGFHDPKHKIHKSARIEQLTWAQVKRLRAKGGYKIERIETMFNLASKKHVRIEFEAKDSKVFEQPAIWKKVRAEADKYHLRQKGKIQVKTIARPSSHGPASRRLKQAHNAGFTTFLLPRNWGKKALPKKEFWPVTSYVRGHVKWK